MRNGCEDDTTYPESPGGFRSEIEYVRLLDDGAQDAPGLLFSAWPDTLDRARRDPVMAWKVQNLRKRAARG